jgi:hypothetical protein
MLMADDPSNQPEPGGSNSDILLYQTEDKRTQIDVRLEEETVWLNQSQMVDLFQTTKPNISLHIRNIFEEGELQEMATVKEYLTVQSEGSRSVSRKVAHYNPRRDHLGRLPRQEPPWHAVPYLGDTAVAGISGQSFHAG